MHSPCYSCRLQLYRELLCRLGECTFWAENVTALEAADTAEIPPSLKLAIPCTMIGQLMYLSLSQSTCSLPYLSSPTTLLSILATLLRPSVFSISSLIITQNSKNSEPAEADQTHLDRKTSVKREEKTIHTHALVLEGLAASSSSWASLSETLDTKDREGKERENYLVGEMQALYSPSRRGSGSHLTYLE